MKWEVEKKKEGEGDEFEPDDVDGVGSEMVEQTGIYRFVSEEAEIGFEKDIRDDGDDEVEIYPGEGGEGGLPPFSCRTPMVDDWEI